MRTWFGVVVVVVWASPIVLPVVGIDAESLVVGGQVERTPDRLVVEDEEVHIVDIVVNEVNLHFILIVSKRTVLSVLAL